MTVRVLCDAIHADLQESLAILFEDRLGWELYYPGGMGWYDGGIWRFERERLGDAVARQFLQEWDGDTLCDYGPGDVRPEGTHWERADHTHPGRVLRRVSVEQARDLRPDVVVSTLAANDAGLAQFAREIGAKFGVHTGNQGQPCLWGAADFALLSSTTPEVPELRIPHVYYRQEFDLGLFHADAGAGGLLSREVQTRVQCAAQSEGYPLFRVVAEATGLPFRHYGHCGPEDDLFGGNAHSTPEVAAQMHAARVAWHWKRWSDGYGHVIHNWFAIGRPVLGTARYYQGKLAGSLFVEGVTSFDLETRTAQEVADIVERLVGDDELYQRMCAAAALRFREVVDFDGEAAQIRAMLEGVLS